MESRALNPHATTWKTRQSDVGRYGLVPIVSALSTLIIEFLITDPTFGDSSRLSNRPLRLKLQIARSPRLPILGSVSNLSPPHKGRHHHHHHHQPLLPLLPLLPAVMQVTKTRRTRRRNSSSSPSRRSSTAKRERTPTSRVSLVIWEW